MPKSSHLPAKNLAGLALLLIFIILAFSPPALAGEGPLLVSDSQQWDEGFGFPGVSGTVQALAIEGDDAYVGGSFISAGGVASGSILRWDGRRWHELDGGVTRPSTIYGEANGFVNAIAVADGKVYVGGQFTKAGGDNANNIAVWDGDNWSPLGSGLMTGGSVEAATVNAITVVGETVYVGGNFDTAGGVAVASVAAWNESTGAWTAVGSGLGGAPYIDPRGTANAIAAGPDGIYVAGDFQSAGGVAANSIARWNPGTSSWTALGEGLRESGYTGTVHALAIGNSSVFVGGWFDTAGNVSANNVAVWNSGTQGWSSLDAGLDDVAIMGQTPVLALAFDGDNLYAGGNFTTAGSGAANRIARWNGNEWQPLVSNGVNGANAAVRALAKSNQMMFAGGDFLSAGDKNVFYVARWEAGEWHALGQGIEVPGINAVAVNQHGEVYVGGYFSHAGGLPVNNIARWDGERWHALGSGVEGGAVMALVVDGENLYAGGRFIEAGGQPAFYVARWNEQSNSWHPLGAGVGYNVETLALSGTTLYVGGHFATAGGDVHLAMARYDLTSGRWSGLGDRLFIDDPGDVYAMEALGDYVYIGGSFSTVNLDGTGGIPVNGLLVWDSRRDEWFRIEEDGYVGVGGAAVYALELAGDDLYVGGSIYSAGPLATSGVARYSLNDGTWTGLGTGVSGSAGDVFALASNGASLFVGGSFDTAGALAANNVARWDFLTNQWSALDNGVTGRTGPLQENDVAVNALAVSGGDIFAAGSFLQAGGLPSHNIARWVDIPATAMAAISAVSGGQLNTADLTIQFPGDAVLQNVTLTYTALPSEPFPFTENHTSLRAWSLRATTPDGRLVSQFTRSYTLVASYSDAELSSHGVDERSLNISYWNGSRWINMLPCSGCTLDTVNNRITVVADHLTIFALTAAEDAITLPGDAALYLPYFVR